MTIRITELSPDDGFFKPSWRRTARLYFESGYLIGDLASFGQPRFNGCVKLLDDCKMKFIDFLAKTAMPGFDMTDWVLLSSNFSRLHWCSTYR